LSVKAGPMSDITYIALITSISDYHNIQPQHMLHNLSQEAAAVRVEGIWNCCLVIVTELWVSHGHCSCLDSCHCTHCTLHYKSVTLGLLWVPMLPQCMPSILPPYWDSVIGPQWGVLLTNKLTLGLVRWASLTFTGLHWGASSVRMQDYVMNVHWTASDKDVRLLAM